MASPSDLIAHYSTRAFLTRLAALTFVGAVIGATLDKLGADREISTIVGFALMAIVVSLGELNRRYTHSYLAACQAAGAGLAGLREDSVEPQRWRIFMEINERQWKNPMRRFLLNWLTYLPGLLLGEYLILRWGLDTIGWVALALGVLVLVMWTLASRRSSTPRL